MKIAIDARLLKVVPDDGISRFTHEVVSRLIARNDGHSFILIGDNRNRKLNQGNKQCEWRYLNPPARHPLQLIVRYEMQLPQLLSQSKADLFFSPDGMIPLKSPAPAVSVIHDINFLHRPEDIPFAERHFYRYFYRRFAEKATRILTVSNFCKEDISAHYNIDPEKIDVAWNGVSGYFHPVGNSLTEEFRKRLTGGAPYFLFVSNFSPRKNIPGMVKAYNLFRERTGYDHKLVLLGGRLFLNSETDRAIASSSWKDDIILPGPVLHSDLLMYYASALALLFVPWFEGFGIPAAEAMRCGTPAILSDTSSLPEVGGDAALYAAPGNHEQIADAMRRLSEDEALRKELSEAGQKQSLRFTWENCAMCAWDSILKSASK